MVVIDEIHFHGGRVLRDVPGGSGFYSTLGARLAVPQSESKTICCLIPAGDDFPSSAISQIQDWGVEVKLQKIAGSPSTRGLLCYKDDVFGDKTFRYTSPPLRPDLSKLPEALLRSSAIHTLASPEDLASQTDTLKTLRGMSTTTQPLIAWEPSPLHCKGAWKDHLDVAGRVGVVSPNDNEVTAMQGTGLGTPYSRSRVEAAASMISGDWDTDEMLERRWVTVVRCGEHGCLVIPRCADPLWLPPYHDIGSEKVVDATGAGNAFLGAFAVAFEKMGDEVLASAYGAVAASFVIEQVGPPGREVVDGREVWNGEEFEARLSGYKDKLASWDTRVESRDLFKRNPEWRGRWGVLFG
ncbi:family carbohydrate kinase [Colletotrichum truncatum]|uniref:Family carbohydrate kinase n=1 Tax=Colletotrichum truncatum TaxID=5467 RepID=A0ACC3ZFU6_COLTU|nr:family carbohydrate kinase [Colletotrichum truncatum]KAF6801903.1 family carbohydrate kinase [Colletotrichum truncatum]